MINKALKIAYDAHHGQADKNGTPYIYHPAYLAAQMDTEEEIITALLHDVVEDTHLTFADLEREGFTQAILEALRHLTHNDGSDYMEHVYRIKQNPLAVKVKLADLRHNSNPTRNANLLPGYSARFREKYAEAIEVLEKQAAKQDD